MRESSKISVKFRVLSLLLLAAAIVLAGLATAGAGGKVAVAICRELVAGTDQGRQALVGSCWYPPVVTIGVLPFVWLLGPGTLAVALAAWAGWSVALLVSYRMADNITPRALALMALLVAVIAATGSGARPEVAFPAAIVLYALREGALWWQRQGLRDLVRLAAAMAGLVLCGMPMAGFLLVLFLLVPLGALRSSESRHRLPAILLLGWLPALYTAGVWLLMNWLVLGTPLFFVANLRHAAVLAWQADSWRWLPEQPLEIAALLAALYALVLGGLRRAPRTAILGALGVACWLWLAVLRGASSSWADTTPLAVMALTSVVALWYLRFETSCKMRVVIGDLLLFAVVGWMGAHQLAPAAGETATEPDIISRARDDALLRSPHARLFLCGYQGLALCVAERPERVEPNFNLDVNDLRYSYHGQTLFLLVPPPVGATAVEDVHSKMPLLYGSGGGRLLFCSEYGGWRLFEVVGAPTARQLEEWRQDKNEPVD